ncbi:MAG TPA: alpha-amylase family glycosyl hydrolase, partial [Phycisphaerales bacterium]|nr:alpha-amylase family glycosyl hydrolase [Phycisphaerales bacterium]
TFTIWSDADAVILRLTHPGTLETNTHALQHVPGEPGLWTREVEGNWRGWTYAYDLHRHDQRLTNILDPWATHVRAGKAFIIDPPTTSRDGLNEPRASVSGSSPTSRPPLPIEDAIIYELHLRDFTHDPSSGVAPANRGKYLGLAQSNTKLNNTNLSTGLDHIAELGVTVVQLMPVATFALPYHPEYEWGYMPTDLRSVYEGYALDSSAPDPAAPAREFKQLISALHAKGLRVTLDMVFNHTYELWPDRLHSFMALAPREYYRFKADGTPWNGALCGNEFRSESPIARRYIVETCKYWITEFGVDGFRFDLMGLIDRETVDQIVSELRAIDPTLLIYGEPWTASLSPADGVFKGAQRSKNFAVFSDEFRDSFRGNVFDMANAGFLAAGHNTDWVKKSILGGVTSFTDSPLEAINYIECHDNHTLFDRLELGARHASPGNNGSSDLTDEDKLKMSMLGVLALMTSQGIPFLHSGQEFARTKDGHADSYNLGDAINNIRWSDKARRADLYNFHRAAVALRKAHPMFRLRTKEEVLRAVKFLDDDLNLPIPRGTVAFHITDPTGRDPWREAVVVLSGSTETAWVPIPEGQWQVHPMPGTPTLGNNGRANDWLEVPAHTGCVLFRGTPPNHPLAGI